MQSHEQIGNLLPHLGTFDEGMLYEVVDTSPTLATWESVGPILDDMNLVFATMAGAYDAGVYSLQRHLRGIAGAADLPIGAAIGVPATGDIVQGFAQDRELNDPEAHAESQTIDYAEALGIDLSSCVLGVTAEPCPDCLNRIDRTDLHRVVYGASRRELENIGVVKKHADTAPEIVRAGRTVADKYGFEFFRIPNVAIQAACLELFTPFIRDLDTGSTTLVSPGLARVTRFASFARDMDEVRTPEFKVPHRRGPEADALVEQFSATLFGFRG